MVSLVAEQCLPFREIAAMLPGNKGKRLHDDSLHRWRKGALKKAPGVRLEARRLGGKWVTSLEAVERFSNALTAAEMAQEEAVALQPRMTSAQQALLEKCRNRRNYF